MDLSLSHLRPNRKRSEEECRATVMLLNGHSDRGAYWYGNASHVIMWDGAWLQDPDVPTVSSRDRKYFDADTMEPLTHGQVHRRMNEHEAYMNHLMDERKAWHEPP